MSKPKLLWKADDQAARLAELIAPTGDPVKDQPLRRDVRSLGVLLGEVLVEQAGQDLFDTVEELRKLMIAHREQGLKRGGGGHLLRRAQEMIAGMDLGRAYQVTKAFRNQPSQASQARRSGRPWTCSAGRILLGNAYSS
jgi:phosphoenolpyruvate carboxylase